MPSRAFRFLLAALMAGVLAACDETPDTHRFLGYVEGEFVLVGPDDSGRLETLDVSEGDAIDAGEPLFALETSREEAAVAAAQARLDQALTSLRLAKVELEREHELLRQGVVTQARVDDAQTEFDTANAATAVARADMEDARTQLARRHVAAPSTGVVEQVYFRPGEIVSAGRPVVSLLPPENVKVRFWVPETVRTAMTVGTTVEIACDGCAKGLTANITFVSREAEYTPPVIFSRDERRKLVFMVEARTSDGALDLPVGQPVTVTPAGADRTPTQ